MARRAGGQAELALPRVAHEERAGQAHVHLTAGLHAELDDLFARDIDRRCGLNCHVGPAVEIVAKTVALGLLVSDDD